MQPLFNRTGSFFKRMFQGTLPDNGYPPVESLECIHVSSITFDISLKLLCPEVSICMWHGRISAAFMTMPETAMNEYHSLVLGEHHVRGTRKFSDMEPIPESSGEKSGAKSSFRPSVLSSDARHHAAALRGRWYMHDLDRVMSGRAKKKSFRIGVSKKDDSLKERKSLHVFASLARC